MVLSINGFELFPTDVMQGADSLGDDLTIRLLDYEWSHDIHLNRWAKGIRTFEQILSRCFQMDALILLFWLKALVKHS